MKIELADRIRELPPYLFAHIDALKNEERKKGKDLIDLGIGDPDLPTPEHIVAALAEAARDPSTHRYPSYVGMEAFRKAAAEFMKSRFGLTFDAQKEVICVIGSKEAIAHFPFAFVNPGRHRPLPRPRLPGLRDADAVRGRRAVFPAAAPRKRLPARPGRDPGGRRAPREDPLDQLPQQPDGRAGRARVLREGGRLRRRRTTSSSPATSPTARCTTSRRRRRSSKRRARARWASSSTRSRRRTT